jgi:L-amino acid N-acyltransferase YncA
MIDCVLPAGSPAETAAQRAIYLHRRRLRFTPNLICHGRSVLSLESHDVPVVTLKRRIQIYGRVLLHGTNPRANRLRDELVRSGVAVEDGWRLMVADAATPLAPEPALPPGVVVGASSDFPLEPRAIQAFQMGCAITPFPGWFLDSWKRRLFWVSLHDGGKLVGLTAVQLLPPGLPRPFAEAGLVCSVCVSPELRGKGLGRRAVLAAMAGATDLFRCHRYFAIVASNDRAALTLHRQVGFSTARGHTMLFAQARWATST